MTSTPIGRTIVLSDAFLESLDEAQLQRYIAALDTVTQHIHPDVDSLADQLTELMADAGVEMSPVEQRMIAEQLLGDARASLRVIDSSGRILHERTAPTSVPATPTDPETRDSDSDIQGARTD